MQDQVWYYSWYVATVWILRSQIFSSDYCLLNFFSNPIKWPRFAWHEAFNLKRRWEKESVNMHSLAHRYTRMHTHSKPVCCSVLSVTGNLLTSFTAGLGVYVCVWVHLSKGHMGESVKQKTFAHWQALMSTLLHSQTHLHTQRERETKWGHCVFEVWSRQIYCSILTGDGI